MLESTGCSLHVYMLHLGCKGARVYIYRHIRGLLNTSVRMSVCIHPETGLLVNHSFAASGYLYV